MFGAIKHGQFNATGQGILIVGFENAISAITRDLRVKLAELNRHDPNVVVAGSIVAALGEAQATFQAAINNLSSPPLPP